MNGFAMEAKCYRDANQFCINHGFIMVPLSTATIDGRFFANNASSKLMFKTVTSTSDPAYRAYQSGNFTATYPVQQQEQIETQHQAFLQQFLATQRQQQQDNQKALQQNRAESDRAMANLSQALSNNKPVLQAHPILPNMQPGQSLPTVPGTSDLLNSQPGRGLPAVWDMPRASDMQTGKTKTGPDGRLWHEHVTPSGYSYWQLDQ
jgi:hypothetical protein